MTADIHFNALVPELSVRDFEASLAFYCERLGFRALYARAEHGFAYLERELAQIMIEQLVDDSWRTGAMERPFGRGLNLQIEVSDVDRLAGDLAAADWPLFRPMEEAWYRVGDRLEGQRQFLVQDPDGYLLRFCQYLGQRNLDEGDEVGADAARGRR